MTISESSPPINTGIKISKKQDNISIVLFSFKSNNAIAMKATETNIIVESRLFFSSPFNSNEIYELFQ